MQPTVRTPAVGRTTAVVGDVYRFLATGEEAKNANLPSGIEPQRAIPRRRAGRRAAVLRATPRNGRNAQAAREPRGSK